MQRNMREHPAASRFFPFHHFSIQQVKLLIFVTLDSMLNK